jgi:hypothetical protein
MEIVNHDAQLLGHVAWDGSQASSERVMLRASVLSRKQVERNQYVRIKDEDGPRSGFLARITGGPFFHRSGSATVGGMAATSSMECFLLAELEVLAELVGGRSRDTNSRPAPNAPVYALTPTEISALHGFDGDMLLGSLAGQDELRVCLKSRNKGVLPRNLGIFGTVGSGKSNTAQVVIEEAARAGWAVVVVDVESEYTEMDQPTDDAALAERLAPFGLRPSGLPSFQVFHPASCPGERATAEAFTLRLADFEANVIGEILQVAIAERNALFDCIEYMQQKARSKLNTSEAEGLQALLDASPQAKVPFTLKSLRERALERSARGGESIDYAGLAAKLTWLMHSEAFDQMNLRSLDPVRMLAPGQVSVIDVSVANDIVKNMLRNVTRRGRKRWLSMAFVSQQPGHLPPEIFELCNTRIVHTLRSNHNLDALMTTTGDVGRDLWARCPLLGPGQAVVSSPQLHRSVIAAIRPATSRRRFSH